MQLFGSKRQLIKCIQLCQGPDVFEYAKVSMEMVLTKAFMIKCIPISPFC